MAYGITTAGFVKKELQTIKTEIEASFQGAFGENIDISTTSVFGLIIGILAALISYQWELGQGVYSSQDPDNSDGVSLDRVAALIQLTRLAATSTLVTAVLYGDQGTVVAAGKKASLDETGDEFSLEASVTIDKADAIEIIFSVTTVLDSTLYQITINSTAFQYTSDATATAEEIIAGLKVEVDAGSEPVTFTDNLDGSANIIADDAQTPFDFLEGANLQVDEVGTEGQFSADDTGSIPAPISTLIDIVTPVSGWNSITNYVAGVTGTAQETDEELRARMRSNQGVRGGGTDEAIKARLLQNVDGVVDVSVISNRTNSVDGEGRPAKSFEVIVDGGVDQEIADEMWLSIPSGIEMYGNETETVIDSQGQTQTIKFTRVEEVYIWLEIDITLTTEEVFPTNGTDTIKDEIILWAEGGTDPDTGEVIEPEAVIGKDVFYQRINIPVFKVSGIATVVIRTATSATPAGPPGAYTSANVTISSREIADYAKNRITVGIV